MKTDKKRQKFPAKSPFCSNLTNDFIYTPNGRFINVYQEQNLLSFASWPHNRNLLTRKSPKTQQLQAFYTLYLQFQDYRPPGLPKNLQITQATFYPQEFMDTSCLVKNFGGFLSVDSVRKFPKNLMHPIYHGYGWAAYHWYGKLLVGLKETGSENITYIGAEDAVVEWNGLNFEYQEFLQKYPDGKYPELVLPALSAITSTRIPTTIGYSTTTIPLIQPTKPVISDSLYQNDEPEITQEIKHQVEDLGLPEIPVAEIDSEVSSPTDLVQEPSYTDLDQNVIESGIYKIRNIRRACFLNLNDLGSLSDVLCLDDKNATEFDIARF